MLETVMLLILLLVCHLAAQNPLRSFMLQSLLQLSWESVVTSSVTLSSCCDVTLTGLFNFFLPRSAQQKEVSLTCTCALS